MRSKGDILSKYGKQKPPSERGRFFPSAEGQNRTGDTLIFSQVLYQLSYLGERSDCTLATEGCQRAVPSSKGAVPYV